MLSFVPSRCVRPRSSRWVVIAACAALLTGSPAHASPLLDPPTMNEGRALLQAERYDEAITVFRAISEAEPDNGAAWFFLGYTLHMTGDLDAALPAHIKAAAHPQFAPTALYNAACVHARKGDADAAFAMLEKALMAGFSNANQMRTDADLESLRKDARFETLLAKVEKAAPARPGAALAASSRQFDFWVGEWDVFMAGGQKAGENRITKELGGTLILEHWRGSQGGEGMSMNFLDSARAVWVQVWVDSAGEIIWTEGGFTDGAMKMKGSHTLRSGDVRPFRAGYTPRDDGTIRQFLEESTDDGATWTTWFDGVYRPHVAGEAAPATLPGGPVPSSTPMNVGGGGGEPGAGQPAQRPINRIRRDFDFWIGEWEVLVPSGEKAGENVISRELNGRLLIERWTSTQGGRGISFNFVDPATRTWKQVWVDASGGHTIKEGAYTDGGMRQTGKRTMPDGSIRLLRATWTPNEDGSVRQLLEESADDGNTWTVWFDGRYVRKAEAPKAGDGG